MPEHFGDCNIKYTWKKAWCQSMNSGRCFLIPTDHLYNMWIAFVFEAVVIVTGNGTVLVVFTRTPSLRKRKHYLLVSLAVADLLVGLVSLPMYVMLNFIHSNRSFLDVYYFQDILFGTASVFGLTAVAIERAYAVYFPFKHRTLGKGTYIISITVVWLMAAILATLEIYRKQLPILGIVVLLLISLFIVMFSYAIIWIKMNCVTAIQNHAIPRRDKKFTVTLFIMTVISLIAWIPFLVINVLVILCGTRCIKVDESFLTITNITKILHYANSLVNPIIYALRMPDFKRALSLRCGCCRYFREILVFFQGFALSDDIHQRETAAEHHDSYQGNNSENNENISRYHENKTRHHGNHNTDDDHPNEHDDESNYHHGNNSKLHRSDNTYRDIQSHSDNCSSITCVCPRNEMKIVAMNNEGFLRKYEETKL